MATNEIAVNVRMNAEAHKIKALFDTIARLSEQIDQMQAELAIVKTMLPDMLEVKAGPEVRRDNGR